MRVLVAPQEFKGTLTGPEAAKAIARGLSAAHPEWEVHEVALADGGPGTLDALVRARGGVRHRLRVEDPLGRRVEAEWASLPDGTAVVEMAQASGLSLLRVDERDPLRGSTFGTGELIRAALDAGHPDLLIGAGGSATNDGGAGALEALGYGFLDSKGRPLGRGGGALSRLARIDSSGRHPALGRAQLRIATDVRNPLLGPTGATAVFSEQKGATVEAKEWLESALDHFARVVSTIAGRDLSQMAGGGAAGGLAFGLAALAGGRIVGGFAEVSEALQLPEQISRADLVITGEGRLDAQTGYGKGPAAVAAEARRMGRRAVCFAGRVEAGRELFDEVVEVSRERVPTSKEEAASLLEASARTWAVTKGVRPLL